MHLSDNDVAMVATTEENIYNLRYGTVSTDMVKEIDYDDGDNQNDGVAVYLANNPTRFTLLYGPQSRRGGDGGFGSGPGKQSHLQRTTKRNHLNIAGTEASLFYLNRGPLDFHRVVNFK